jgi:hypothetical protein
MLHERFPSFRRRQGGKLVVCNTSAISVAHLRNISLFKRMGLAIYIDYFMVP